MKMFNAVALVASAALGGYLIQAADSPLVPTGCLSDTVLSEVYGGEGDCWVGVTHPCSDPPAAAQCGDGQLCEAEGGAQVCPGDSSVHTENWTEDWNGVTSAPAGLTDFGTWEPIACFVSYNCDCQLEDIIVNGENVGTFWICRAEDNPSSYDDYHDEEFAEGDDCPSS